MDSEHWPSVSYSESALKGNSEWSSTGMWKTPAVRRPTHPCHRSRCPPEVRLKVRGESVGEALPRLLDEHGLSMRELARRADVDQSHLSRLSAGPSGGLASGSLAERVAEALGLPSDYFPEARRSRLLEAIDRDSDLRDKLYDRYGSKR